MHGIFCLVVTMETVDSQDTVDVPDLNTRVEMIEDVIVF